jgi:hypothetical protein
MSRRAPTLGVRLTRSAGRGRVLALWGGRGAGGRSLLYTVLASIDGGENFSPEIIQSSLRGVRFIVPPHSRVVVKVIATDGSRSVTAQRAVTAG